MFLKRYLFNRRYNRLSSAYTKEGNWIVTPDSLNALASLLTPKDLNGYKPKQGVGIKVGLVHRTALSHIELLDMANGMVRDDQEPKGKVHLRRDAENIRSIRLDDYLVVNDNIPIRPEELLNAFQKQISNLKDNLTALRSDSPHKYDYYVRHFSHLLNDVFVVLLALVEVARNASQ